MYTTEMKLKQNSFISDASTRETDLKQNSRNNSEMFRKYFRSILD